MTSHHLPVGHSNRVLLLDANVLLLLLVGLWNRARVGTHKKTSAYEPEDFDLISEIARGFGTLATTPHVLAEMSNHADFHEEPERSDLFISIQRRIPMLQELTVDAAVSVSSPAFVRLGLTDAAIAHLASSNALVVLTTDLDLWLHLQKLQVPAYNYNHFKGDRIIPHGLQ